jgi:hypothetical protein
MVTASSGSSGDVQFRDMAVICWGSSAAIQLSGIATDSAVALADRWCAELGSPGAAGSVGALKLEIPDGAPLDSTEDPRKIRISLRDGDDISAVRLRVGPHTLHASEGRAADRISFSNRRSPSPFEVELLIDLGIIHLLARQGLPVLHGCAFELGGRSVFGLGGSFAGKTTVSVAAMRAGGRVVSDDAVLAIPSADNPYSLVPVRSYGWLRGKTREIVPDELREKMVENEEDGQPRWVLNREDGGEGFVDRVVPEVIWIQSIDRRLKESRVEPVDQGQVFAALIRASSPLYLSRHCPEIRDRLIPVFRGLCAQCRGFRVRLSPRLLEAPEEEIKRLLDLSR